MPSGLKWEAFSRKDYNFHKIYGSAVSSEPIVPLNRDISGLNVIYQGNQNTCVSCSVTWIRQYLSQAKPSLSWPFLAKISNTASDGVVPSQVLEAARKTGIILEDKWKDEDANKSSFALKREFQGEAAAFRVGSYSYLTKLDRASVYQALKVSPLAIGVDDWQGAGPHMMAAFDVTEDGTALKCVNWWNPTVQDIQIVPFEKLEMAIVFHEKPLNTDNISMSIFDLMRDLMTFIPFKRVSAFIAGALLLLLSVFTSGEPKTVPVEEQKLGASGVAAFYSSTIGGAGINSSASTIPVTTVTLFTGETLQSSDLTFPIYLVIDPNSRSQREIVECWGLSTSSTPSTWTGCVRGLSAKGYNTTSTVSGAAFAHAPGTAIIMSDTPSFYNRFLDRYTDQSATGTKTFLSNSFYLGDDTTSTKKRYFFNTGQSSEPYLYFSGTSTMGFAPDGLSEFAFNTGGTTVGVDPTGALYLTGGLLGINVSSTGLATSSNFLYVNVSSTASANGGFLQTAANGKIYWDVLNFLAGNWTFSGTNIFSATNTFSGTTLITGTSTSTQQAANRGYVDAQVAYGSATATASGAVTAGQAIYATGTNQVTATNSSAATSTFKFVGVALNSAASGSIVNYSRPGEVNCTLSGLTTGSFYYLNGAAGQLATTPGTFLARVGTAISANCLQIDNPYYKRTGVRNTLPAGTFFEEVGFYPAKISIIATATSTGAGGWSNSNDSGGVAIDNTGIYFAHSTAGPFGTIKVNGGGRADCATPTRLAQGFTWAVSDSIGQVGICMWEAESQ